MFLLRFLCMESSQGLLHSHRPRRRLPQAPRARAPALPLKASAVERSKRAGRTERAASAFTRGASGRRVRARRGLTERDGVTVRDSAIVLCVRGSLLPKEA